MESSTVKQYSRTDFSLSSTTQNVEGVKMGSLQRIADATELMAKNYISLQQDKDNYQRWYKEERARVAKLYLRVAALKGVITKLKKAPKTQAVITHEN